MLNHDDLIAGIHAIADESTFFPPAYVAAALLDVIIQSAPGNARLTITCGMAAMLLISTF
jgi:hypothetical protein